MPTGFPELDQLPPDKKLELAAELWRDATSDEGAPPVDPRIIEVIEERWKAHQENPELAISWQELKAKLLKE
jgi:hypothetical protein